MSVGLNCSHGEGGGCRGVWPTVNIVYLTKVADRISFSLGGKQTAEKMRPFKQSKKQKKLVCVNRDATLSSVSVCRCRRHSDFKGPVLTFYIPFFSDAVQIKATAQPQIGSILVLAATAFCSARCVAADLSSV